MNLPKLYRFGKREHIESLVYNGELQLSPASSFDEPNLASGQHDPDELVYKQQLPQGTSLEVFNHKGISKGKLEVANFGPLVATSVTDYYVYCLSMSFNQRLFDEFNADACAVINDPVGFIDAVSKVVIRDLPRWGGFPRSVQYLSEVDSSRKCTTS